MQPRWRTGNGVIARCVWAGALLGVLALGSGAALACSTNPPLVDPSPDEAARDADIVAIVRVYEEIPVPAGELARAEELWRNPPPDTPISFPGPKSRFHVLRELKGTVPPDLLLQNGGTTCETWLPVGSDYLLFAKLPPPDGARLLWPLRGTFALGGDEHDRARLAEVELALKPLKSTP